MVSALSWPDGRRRVGPLRRVAIAPTRGLTSLPIDARLPSWPDEPPGTRPTSALMHVRFLGEPDSGIRPSSQWARALSSLGIDATVSAEPEWDRQAWQEVCNRCDVIHLIAYSQHDHRLLRKLWQARKRGVGLVHLGRLGLPLGFAPAGDAAIC